MTVQYKNVNTYYTSQGKGKTIILLHGFLENQTMWNNLIPQLIKQYRVVTIDLLGHGKSDCLGYIHTMETMAEAVNSVLEKLNITKADFIGHSMGGYVALAFAKKFPHKVSGLCLLNSTSASDSDERQQNRDRAIKAVKQNHKTFVSMAIANLFAENNRKRLSLEIEHVKNEALKMPVQGIIAALEGMKVREDKTLFFTSLNCKKMVVYGLKDTVLNANSIIQLYKNSDIILKEFPDGHMSHIENMKELTYTLLQFIEK